MGAYTGVKNLFKENLINIALILKYSEDNICILKGDLETLKSKFPETYSNLISCAMHKDNRDIIEYGRDLIASWIMEDFIFLSFKAKGYKIKLHGADKKRKVLPSSKTKTDSDFELIIEDEDMYSPLDFKIELMCDYTGYWERTKKVDLRNNKFVKMCKERVIFLGISVPLYNEYNREDKRENKDDFLKYFLIDFCYKTPIATHIEHYKPYGGKSIYQIDLEEMPVKFEKFNAYHIVSDIQGFIIEWIEDEKPDLEDEKMMEILMM